MHLKGKHFCELGMGMIRIRTLLTIGALAALAGCSMTPPPPTQPRIAQPEGSRRFRRSATVELLVGALVVALTAVLVATEPPDMSERSDTERASATLLPITR